MKEPTLQTRREFLRTGVLGGAASWTLPSFVHLTMKSLADAADGSLSQTATGRSDPILVVLQLAGGNDGLNTVIPVGNDFYHKARPSLALPKRDCLLLDDEHALHPSLSGLNTLYDAGHLGIIQGVGYPNPNRSHFRSMEIWHTASDARRVESLGWLGRYFDCCCEGMDASAGVGIGRQAPQAFTARNPKGVTFQNANQYRFTGDEEFLMKVAASDDFHDDLVAGDSIDMLSGGGEMRTTAETPLDFLERTSLDAQVTSDRIQEIAGSGKNQVPYPSTRLARDMSLVARLIAGGMPTRVYYVSQGGYDTHTSQKGTHERLLREMGDTVKAFIDDITAQGNLDRVVLMSFSEFGRRVKQNASGGTDHGKASPMFVAGGRVKGGIHGRLPSLAPADLDRGDLRYGIDFRSVYATVLEHHLGADAKGVLRKPFPLLDVINKA